MCKNTKNPYTQYKDGKMYNFRCNISQKEHEGSLAMFICLITHFLHNNICLSVCTYGYTCTYLQASDANVHLTFSKQNEAQL